MHLRTQLSGSTAVFQAADQPGGAPPPPAAPPAGDPPAAAPAAAAPVSPPLSEAPPVAAPPAPAPAPAKPDWRDARIAELTAKLNDPAVLQQRLKEKGIVPAAPASASPPAAPAPVDPNAPEVLAMAGQIAQLNEWNRQCNEVAAAGKKAFPDFDARMQGIMSMIDPGDAAESQRYQDFLTATIETGFGPQILHKLGENPTQVKELMGLSPVKLAVKLAGLAATFAPPVGAPEPSGAAPPITPIGSHGNHYDGIKPDDPVNGSKLPKADWFRMREQQAAERGIQ